MRIKPASTTRAGCSGASKRSMIWTNAASNASREAKALCSSTSVAMPCSRAKTSPPADALLLITAATRAPNLSGQPSRCAVFTMAAMLEPLPEIKITMFFISARIMTLTPSPLITPLAPSTPSPVLTPIEARVLGTLMEKARTVPDSYPLTLNTLLLGCNQKSSREPLMELSEADVAAALNTLKEAHLVRESSGSRTTRFEHNFQRGIGVYEQAAVLLGLLMLRGPQTAGELRLNTERWYKFADSSSVEGFLEELQDRAAEKGARWWSNWRVDPALGSNAGRTCCAARWMRRKRGLAARLNACRATPQSAWNGSNRS